MKYNFRTYLEALDNGASCFNTAKAAAILNISSTELMKRYDNKGRNLNVYLFDTFLSLIYI